MIVAALLLAVAAAGNPDVHVVRVAADGSVAALAGRSELHPGEEAWVWSYASLPVRIREGDRETVTAQKHSVVIQVIGPGHKPEPGTSIRWGSEAMLREVPDTLLPEAVTDAKGMATIVAPATGALYARVAGPALGSGWKTMSATSKMIVFHALPASDLRIRVTDARGRAAAKARVEVRGADVTAQSSLPMWGYAADGRVEVPGLPAAEAVELLAWSDTLAPSLTTTRVSSAPPVLLLEPGTFFEATVVDEARRPVAGVTARIAFPLAGARRVMTRMGHTGTAGALRVGGLPPGESTWAFSREGYAGLLGAGELPPSGRHLGTLLLQRGRELSVKVLDDAGKPLSGASVRTQDGSGRVVSGADGVAFLRNVSGGLLQATVQAKGFRPAQLDIPDPVRQMLQVALVRGAGVRARLVASDGVPLSAGGKVVMEIDGARSSLDFDGDTLDLDGLPACKLRLEIRPAGRAPLRIPERRIALGERVDLGTLRFGTGLTLRGMVVDDVTGVPVPGASLRVLRPNTFSTTVAMVMGDTVTAESGENGEFVLAGLSPGLYTLAAEAPGFARTFRTDIQLHGEGETDLGAVRLPEARTLSIHCMPVEKCGTEVRVLLAGAQNDWAAVDAPLVDGKARLLPVAAGTATLRLVDGREIIAEKEVSIAADRERTELEIDLGSMRVRGVVTRGSAPVAGGSLTFLSGSQTPRRVVQVSQVSESGAGSFSPRIVGDLPRQVAVSVDGEGRFATAELSAGDYNVTYVDAAGQSAPRTVSVSQASESTLDLDWPAGRIRGYVHTADGHPAGGAMITVRDAGGQGPLAMASADGTFTISGLASGSAEISASKGKTRARQTVGVGDPAKEYVDLELDEAHDRSLTVNVLDGRGVPVSNAFVFLLRPEGLVTAATDANGAAEVTLREGESAGGLAAFTPARGWSFCNGGTGDSVTLRFGDDCGDLVVRAGSSGTLSCEARSPTGFPITQALAILGGSITAAAGRPLEIHGLPPGTYTVLGRGAGMQSIEVATQRPAVIQF